MDIHVMFTYNTDVFTSNYWFSQQHHFKNTVVAKFVCLQTAIISLLYRLIKHIRWWKQYLHKTYYYCNASIWINL